MAYFLNVAYEQEGFLFSLEEMICGEYFAPRPAASKNLRSSALLEKLEYLKMTGKRRLGPGITQSEVSLVVVSTEREMLADSF